MKLFDGVKNFGLSLLISIFATSAFAAPLARFEMKSLMDELQKSAIGKSVASQVSHGPFKFNLSVGSSLGNAIGRSLIFPDTRIVDLEFGPHSSAAQRSEILIRTAQNTLDYDTLSSLLA